MKLQPAVRTETKKIAVGTILLTVLMIAVFLVIGQFDYTVLLGALLGCAAAIGNFFLMAVSVQKAADSMPRLPREEEAPEGEGEEETERPLSDEAKIAGKKMQASYTVRMFLLAGVAAIAAGFPIFHTAAALIPLLFPRIVIFIFGLIQNQRKEA